MKNQFCKIFIWLGACVLILLVFAAVFIFHQPKQSEMISKAAMAGDLELLQKAEKNGANLNAQDPKIFFWSPLMISIYHGKTNISQYLLTKDVNINLQDRDGRTALMLAVMTLNTNIIGQLLDKGADVTIKDKDGIDASGYAKGNGSADAFLKLLQGHNILNKSGN